MLRVVLVVLFAVTAALNAESFDEKLSSFENVDSNLGPVPYPDELTDELANDQDLVEDTADTVPSKEHLDFFDEDNVPEEELDDEIPLPQSTTEDNIQEDKIKEEFPEENDLNEEGKSFDAEEKSQGEDVSRRWVVRLNCSNLPQGFSCCGRRPYNISIFGCCNGRLYSLRYYQCCSRLWITRKCLRCLSPRTCGGVSYNPYTHGCCRVGSRLARYYRFSQKCCFGRLVSIRSRCLPLCGSKEYLPPYQRCCGTTIYDPRFGQCCFGRIIRIRDQCLPRCGLRTYIPPLQRCCNGGIVKRVYYPYHGQRCCRGGRVVSNCGQCPTVYGR